MRVAKELRHIQRWLSVAAMIVAKGEAAYEADEAAQEADDSVMIKIGEAAKTLASCGVTPPSGVSWSDADRYTTYHPTPLGPGFPFGLVRVKTTSSPGLPAGDGPGSLFEEFQHVAVLISGSPREANLARAIH